MLMGMSLVSYFKYREMNKCHTFMLILYHIFTICSISPLCKPYVSACTEFFFLCSLHLPLLYVDWGSVQCSHMIRHLILSRQRGSMSPPCITPLRALHVKASLSLTNYHTQLPQSKQLSHTSVTDYSFCIEF